MSRSTPRRLIDLPGVADLELKAVMKRDFAEPQARADHPELDAVSLKLFELTADQAEATPRPADWDSPEDRPVLDQLDALEDAGWDLRDNNRRPLRIFGHFNQQLWLALRGVAGAMPFIPDDDPPDAWGSAMSAEATRFRRR